MNNPFLMALKANPAQFLNGLQTRELEAIAQGCVARLETNAKKGDRDATLALQAIYRVIGAVEI
ncbi:MAG: hypothetical protein A2516_05985 [Alphaproteobacteria bacterium RIFOXYD12_FULL_60_8]|nr:MAG: hypothetical protein A2516_05985 [Alphaproteobacteria bacterium RIFOXYD12_FULL_60_8]